MQCVCVWNGHRFSRRCMILVCCMTALPSNVIKIKVQLKCSHRPLRSCVQPTVLHLACFAHEIRSYTLMAPYKKKPTPKSSSPKKQKILFVFESSQTFRRRSSTNQILNWWYLGALIDSKQISNWRSLFILLRLWLHQTNRFLFHSHCAY